MPDLILLAVVSVAVFVLAALAQAVTGFGSALVAVPLLALTVDPVTAVVAATCVGLILTTGSWRRERHHADHPTARVLTLTGVVGMPAGLVALAVLDESTLSSVIAGVLLLLVVSVALGLRLPPGRVTLVTCGVLSGGLLTSTGMNGPPLVLALQDLEPRRYRATLQAVFCGQDALAVLAFAVLGHLSGQVLLITVSGVVGLPLGWAVGDHLFRRIPARHFRLVILGGLAATAITLLVT